MKYVLKNGMVFDGSGFVRRDVVVIDGFISSLSSSLFDADVQILDLSDKYAY